ncbi:MAG: hypothetical protein AUJ70_04220 [Candidatus Omnitrophica bacterium CG1_02_40_15]|nr:MAG: hypothetical protein AUJ70_04220 [Candidatus Omnitrophica bacterium CG1_02_40_15]
MISLIGKKRSSGFLFVELLISVLIMSVGLILILNSFIQSLRAIEYSDDYFKACLFLEDKAFEVYNSDKKEGFSKGSFNDFNDKFSWELNVAKLEEAGLNEISLKVMWYERNKEHDVPIFTYL